METLELDLSMAVRPLSYTWRESLRALLQEKGFSTATSYVDHQPQRPLWDLAADLAAELAGGAATAIELERLVVEEAEATGTMERCARSLFSRDLRDQLPEGWTRGSKQDADDVGGALYRQAGVFLTLTMALPDLCEPAVERVRRAMLAADIPSGWVPSGPDDLVLVEVFGVYWTAP